MDRDEYLFEKDDDDELDEREEENLEPEELRKKYDIEKYESNRNKKGKISRNIKFRLKYDFFWIGIYLLGLFDIILLILLSVNIGFGISLAIVILFDIFIYLIIWISLVVAMLIARYVK